MKLVWQFNQNRSNLMQYFTILASKFQHKYHIHTSKKNVEMSERERIRRYEVKICLCWR